MNENEKTKISDLFNSSPNQQDVYGSMNATASHQPENASTGEDLSNPFASDMKTDLAGSQMSMDMSGFSQFFEKQSDSSKKIILGVGIVVIVAGLFFIFTSDSSDEEADSSDFYGDTDTEDNYDENEMEEDNNDENIAEDNLLSDNNDFNEDNNYDDADNYDDMTSDAMSEDMVASGALRLITPMDGQARGYDETAEYALFEWEGSSSATVVFSRNANMNPVEKRVYVSGNSYRLAHPWPGTWYWQVQGDDGDVSEVSRFIVDAPVRRQVAMAPLPSPLSGNGGVVSWTGDTKVARYTVELSQSGWANPAMRYQTSGTSLPLTGVTPGQYQVRVGAFSEVSGRWEYTPPVSVSIE